MLETFRSVLSPIISLIILMVGNGLFMTYVSLRLTEEGVSNLFIGIITAAYYFGFFIASLRVHKLIERIGHIRAFAGFASFNAFTILAQCLWINPWAWMVFRFLSGICLAGLFIVVESWLLVRSHMENRGKVLSIYMIAFYLAIILGQFLLDLSPILSFIPFVISAIFTTVSVVPISLTRTLAPIAQEPSYLNIGKLFKISPIGVIGAFISGMILGTVYGLAPVYAQEIHLDTGQIAQFMGLTIFGGLVLQWPLGHLSDHVDRRIVLLGCAILTAIFSFLVGFTDAHNLILLYILVWLFGGFSFVMYPISISHACDLVESKDVVAATGGLLLAYGLGSVLGPLFAPYSMQVMGPAGLYYYFLGLAVLLSIITLLLALIKKAPAKAEKLPYSNIPRTTTLAGELDPRSDAAYEEQSKQENNEKKK